MKYIIEIEDDPLVRKSCLYGETAVYRAAGFQSLVFDEYGLSKLHELTEPDCIDFLHSTGWLQGHDELITETEYEKGREDGWSLAKIFLDIPYLELCDIFGWDGDDPDNIDLRKVTLDEASQKLHAWEERHPFKVGDVISFGNEVLLITKVTDKSYECLSGRSFEPVSIGKGFENQMRNLNDRKDMTKLIEGLKGKEND